MKKEEKPLKGKQFKRKSKGQIARESRRYRQHLRTGVVTKL